ncbi:MAG: acyl-CoA reductase [Limisphaerales bacterium]
MNLPNYFLADIAAEAPLTPAMISEACQTLKRNRERYLVDRSTSSLIRVISDVAQSWLDPEYPFRQEALAHGPEKTGFPRETLEAGLDAFFAQITPENLQKLLEQEFGHDQRLDTFSSSEVEQQEDRAAMVRGHDLLVHITGGCLPNSTLTSIIFGLFVRSAQFVKCASGTAFLPRLFAHSLYEADSKLGACLEIAEWRGGSADLETALYEEADCLTATGSDETLAAIRQKLPLKVRFVGYGHKVSFGYVSHESLSGVTARKMVAKAALDVIAWNQLGCLSPHVFYVEAGGSVTPELFAELLARELEAQESKQPRGAVDTEASAAIAYRRSFYEVRAASSEETRLWQSEASTAWTVIYENDPRFQLSCLNRFIYVKTVSNIEEVLRGADAVFGKVSTVGLAATGVKAQQLAQRFARWGVTRICPLGQMQDPPLTWRHDGRPALGDLVMWTDWEM